MHRRLASLSFLALATLAGCPERTETDTTQGSVAWSSPGGEATLSSSATTAGGAAGHYLYVPATGVPTSGLDAVEVVSSNGQTYRVPPSDVRVAAAGRLAIVVPDGYTDGVVNLRAGALQVSVPFHVVAWMTAAQPIGTVIVQQAADPDCRAVAGEWAGTITDDPGSSATVTLEVLSDCRSVQGLTHLGGPSIGSVDSTVDGTWDSATRTLNARDTQLFNVRPTPGSGFCPTTRYALSLSPDGMQLDGENLVSDTGCVPRAPVHLRRVR